MRKIAHNFRRAGERSAFVTPSSVSRCGLEAAPGLHDHDFMLRARDIMTRQVLSLAEDTSIDAAAWQLAAESVSGAPVRDRRGNIVGVLSRSDLVDPLRHGEAYQHVSDAMTPGVWAVHPDEPAIEAVKLMVDARIHRVIVIRGPGKLEGIISTMDVMRALVRGADFHGTRGAALVRDEGEGDSGDDDAEGAEADGRRGAGRAVENVA